MRLRSWTMEIAAGELVYRGDRGITGVIRVVRRGPIDDVAAVAHGQVVGNRDRLRVGDAEAMEMARQRCPGPHARGGAGLGQVDRGPIAKIVAFAVAGKIALMRAPAQLGRLRTLADKAVNRPGVHELAQLLRSRGNLGIALGDMDDADAQQVGQRGPVFLGGGIAGIDAGVGSDVQHPLLDQVRHHARVGTVRDHRGGRALIAGTQRQGLLAQRIVGPARSAQRGVGVATGPGLNAGVQVHRALFPAEADQGDARDIDRDIQQEIAAADQRRQDATEVVTGQGFDDALDTEMLSLRAA